MIYFRFVLKVLMWGSIVSMAWMVLSCEEFCEESNRTAVVVNFYDATDTQISVKDVAINGIENDSVLYPNRPIFGGTDFKQVLLPVNPTTDLMSFSIKKDTFPADTLIIRYNRHNGFISAQCGCVTFAEIQGEPENTNHTIVDMVVTNPNVTTVSYRQRVVNAENIKIYY